MKMWGGRFDKEPDSGFMDFTSSLGFDVRLYPYDLRCTAAWAGELARSGILTEDEEAGIKAALRDIRMELDSGTFSFLPADEDIHTAIERRLVEMVGQYGGKVRTGRSRNDTVATDMRMMTMEQCVEIASRVRSLQRALLDKARATADLPVPGHTHLQQAQPVLMAQLLLAFVFMLQRDRERLRNARDIADSLPLGSGALAGTSVAVDREALAGELGFSKVSENSVDAVSDRDFICDFLHALSTTMVHLSRLAEQVILWCSSEFGMMQLDDAWATGSSLMPQKKNPDGPELVRAKAGRVIGSLVTMLTVLKGIPLAYNRDLQEDKEALFDAVETTRGSLKVMEKTIETAKFDRARAVELARSGFMTATDLADYLVAGGVDYPRAHRIAGEVVNLAMERGGDVAELTVEELRDVCDAFDDDVRQWLSTESSIAKRGATGGTSPESVSRQIELARRLTSGEGSPL